MGVPPPICIIHALFFYLTKSKSPVLWEMNGGVAEWLKAAGCKPVDVKSSVVQIHPPPPVIQSLSV